MSAENDAVLLEVRALARRARGNANFYGHAGAPAIAFRALADDLDALAERMTPSVIPPAKGQAR